MGATRPPAVSWNWSEALRGTLCCLPAAVILLVTDNKLGIGFAIGVLPVALLGVMPSSKRRVQGMLLGVAFAVVFLLGSVVSQIPLVAVFAVFGVAYGAAMLASKRPIGRVVLGLMLPALVVGLSSAGAISLITSLFLVAGSIWVTAVTRLCQSEAQTLISQLRPLIAIGLKSMHCCLPVPPA